MGAYVRDKNTSARVCTKNAGGGRGIFAGHYGTSSKSPYICLSFACLARGYPDFSLL